MKQAASRLPCGVFKSTQDLSRLEILFILKQGKQLLLLAAFFMLVSCLAYSSTLKKKEACSSGTLADFFGLHGVIAQRTKLFITTAVRTSNPTFFSLWTKIHIIWVSSFILST
jgi:hypothetical protein